jgi:hypothetical protein
LRVSIERPISGFPCDFTLSGDDPPLDRIKPVTTLITHEAITRKILNFIDEQMAG